MNKIEKFLAIVIASFIILIFLAGLILGIFAIIKNNALLAIKFFAISAIIYAGGFIL